MATTFEGHPPRHPPSFGRHHAAVHRQNGSSDSSTLVGCKKENRFCYIARLTIPSQWVESIEGWQNLRDLFLERNVE
jgi:hypothetical protein